ncbi:MAG: hypothetical protein O2904_05000 [bacterium]|nr:hypothetical protein [bacterium]
MGVIGLDAQGALAGGDFEFQELEVGITRDLVEARVQNSRDVITADRQQEILEAMKTWDRSQKGFFTGRKNVFEFETEFFPNSIRDELRARFNQFDASIYWSQLQTEERAKIDDMWIYAFRMGYQVPMLA